LRLLTSKKLSLIVVRPNGSVKFEGRKVPCSRACREHHVPGVKVKVLVSLPQLSGQEEGGEREREKEYKNEPPAARASPNMTLSITNISYRSQTNVQPDRGYHQLLCIDTRKNLKNRKRGNGRSLQACSGEGTNGSRQGLPSLATMMGDTTRKGHMSAPDHSILRARSGRRTDRSKGARKARSSKSKG
jgi:hypothetical protein